MAIPTLFSSTFVGPDYAAVELNGGHLMSNNPARELLKEAQRVYGNERRLSLILSLGSGKPKAVSLGTSNEQSAAMEQLLTKLVPICW
jgi:precorrin-6B methylase 1